MFLFFLLLVMSVADECQFIDQQQEIVEEFKWSWNAYRDYAWGKDELLPVSQTSNRWFGIGLTLLDNLDTLWLMNLHEEFDEATEWVRHSLDMDIDVDVNVFECTIRALGGLLSAHALSNRTIFLDKAYELGSRLLPAFETKTGIPYSDVNLKTGAVRGPHWTSASSTSEVSTVQLEFIRLTQVTGDVRFRAAVTRVADKMAVLAATSRPHPYLLPIFIQVESGHLSGPISLGARGDSYYEYLLKQWIQSGGTILGDRYFNAAEAIRQHLVVKVNNKTFIAEMNIAGELVYKMDHLVCFLPGVYALGTTLVNTSHHLRLAQDLMETCYAMYQYSPIGLAPEIIMFDCTNCTYNSFYIKRNDEHNLLRPETVESLFVLWRVTRDPKYRQWGWEIFKSFQQHCKVSSGGYSSIRSVVKKPIILEDKMESFWMAETLKYLYLLFAEEDVLPLDKWVFNTEAHPFPVVSKT